MLRIRSAGEKSVGNIGYGKVRDTEVLAFLRTRSSQATAKFLIPVLVHKDARKRASDPVIKGARLKVAIPVAMSTVLESTKVTVSVDPEIENA